MEGVALLLHSGMQPSWISVVPQPLPMQCLGDFIGWNQFSRPRLDRIVWKYSYM